MERTTINEQNNTVTNVSSDTVASVFFGYFKRGQAYKPILVVDEPDLVKRFGEPVALGDEKNQIDFYTANDYLKFVAPLYILRCVDITTARNATLFVSSVGVLSGDASNFVKRINDDVMPVITKADPFEFGTVLYSSYPAIDSNSLKVAIGDDPAVDSGFSKRFGEIFNGIVLGANELYLVIGSGNSVLEKFIISKNESSKDEVGNSNFIDNVLKKSTYLRSKSNVPMSGVVDIGVFSATSLSGGYSKPVDQSVDLNMIEDFGIKQLYNKEKYSINLIIDTHLNTGAMKAKLLNLAGGRGESAVVLAPSISEGILYNNMHTSVEVDSYYSAFMSILDASVSDTKNMSYGSAFLNFKVQYDKYNGVSFINSYAGEVAGTIVSSIYSKGLNVAVAGVEDGLIFSSGDMVKKWNGDDRQALANNRINPIIKMPQVSEFPMIYDYLTTLNEDSILNKFHTRLILNEVKRFVRRYSNQTLIFDKSSSSIRNKFVLKVDKDLTKFKNDEIIVDYRIKDNTSAKDVEDKTARFTINIKIAGLIREIFIDLVVVSESVSLSERLVA